MVEPPPHIGANHIYSNSYRKAIAGGMSKDAAQKRARKAAKIFRDSGMVRKHHVGGFHLKPRASNAAAPNHDD